MLATTIVTMGIAMNAISCVRIENHPRRTAHESAKFGPVQRSAVADGQKEMWRSVLVGALSGAVGCSDAQGGQIPDLGPPAPTASIAKSIDFNPRLLRRFRPLHAAPEENVNVVALGKLLFFDPRLSHDGDLSCNSCHPLDRGGTDHASVSI